MRTHRIPTFVASIAISLAPANAATWQTQTYETDGFTVDFSGKVRVKPIEVDAEAKKNLVRSTSYMQDGGDSYVYIVGASLLREGAVFDFDAGVKGTMDTYKCAQIDTDKAANPGAVRSREIRAAKCIDGKVRIGAKFFHQGPWFYQVVYMIAPGANAADAAHFFASFKIVTPPT